MENLVRGRLEGLGWQISTTQVRAAGGNGAVGLWEILGVGGEAFLLAAVGADQEAARALLVERLHGRGGVTLGVVAGEREAAFFRFLPALDRCVPVPPPDPWVPPAVPEVPGARTGSGRFEDLLFALHSHMRDMEGLHPPEALDELCKLLFLKLSDEAGAGILHRARYGCGEELAAVARRLYGAALAGEGLRRVPVQAWPPILLGSTALARCIEELAPWSLREAPADLEGRAFQDVLGPAFRASMGQYLTPESVGRLMVDVLAPEAGERVLDPFAGSGHFLSLVAARARPGCPPAAMYAIEKSPRMVRVAWIGRLLSQLPPPMLAEADSLAGWLPPGFDLEGFDVVVTNPPFGSVLRADAVRSLGPYVTANRRSAVPVEVLGLERAVGFLKPGGRLGIVLPDGVLGNRREARVRAWLGETVLPRALVSLPVETFAPFGASVRASILFARRLHRGEATAPERPVFLARADRVGHDASGRTTASDLPEIGKRLRAFLAEEGW